MVQFMKKTRGQKSRATVPLMDGLDPSTERCTTLKKMPNYNFNLTINILKMVLHI
jgi:hypothetical protein